MTNYYSLYSARFIGILHLYNLQISKMCHIISYKAVSVIAPLLLSPTIIIADHKLSVTQKYLKHDSKQINKYTVNMIL